ncbi:MAG: hypothetical protein OEU44_07230 [Gammaproteobacteria bacterium]|nr:hypothetical protein [Gammaproteobacteria bacterium]
MITSRAGHTASIGQLQRAYERLGNRQLPGLVIQALAARDESGMEADSVL